jgi:hypothetical protein
MEVLCVDCAGNGPVLLHRPSLPVMGMFISPVRRQETDSGAALNKQGLASLRTRAAN